MIKKSKAVILTALLFNWRLYYYYSFPVSCLLFPDFVTQKTSIL